MRKGLVYIPVFRDKYALIDAANAVKVSNFNWHMDSKGYPTTKKNGRRVSMHHLVNGKPPKGLVTDHINRNPLDNRIENLRFVTQSENMINRDMDGRNKSGYIGVYWHTRQKKWCAKIRRNYRDIHVGYYSSPEDANTARIKVLANIDTSC